MTFFTHTQLLAAVDRLDDARKKFNCPELRTDPDGQDSFGDEANRILYGTHGAAFLQVDPETLELRCGACDDKRLAIVKPKIPHERRGKMRFMTGE